MFKANGCWPSIAIAGFLMLGTAPIHACDTAHCDGRIVVADNSDKTADASDAVARTSHHRHHAHHAWRSHSHRHAKASHRKTTDPTDDNDDLAAAGGPSLSPTVANASAQMITPADAKAPAGAPQPTAGPSVQAPVSTPNASNDAPQDADAGSVVVAADELNDVDRSATPEKSTGRILHPVPQTPHPASASSEDAWGQTSLIGKVFIVLGGVLTVASAARMFFA
jgi:hypothetical protein